MLEQTFYFAFYNIFPQTSPNLLSTEVPISSCIESRISWYLRLPHSWLSLLYSSQSNLILEEYELKGSWSRATGTLDSCSFLLTLSPISSPCLVKNVRIYSHPKVNIKSNIENLANKKQTWNSDLFIAFLLKANEDFPMFPPFLTSIFSNTSHITWYIFQIFFTTPCHENFHDFSMLCFCLLKNVTAREFSEKIKLKLLSKQVYEKVPSQITLR